MESIVAMGGGRGGAGGMEKSLDSIFFVWPTTLLWIFFRLLLALLPGGHSEPLTREPSMVYQNLGSSDREH